MTLAIQNFYYIPSMNSISVSYNDLIRVVILYLLKMVQSFNSMHLITAV
jgi:hypothetical protein